MKQILVDKLHKFSKNVITEKFFIKNFKEEYEELSSWFFPLEFRFSQKLYHYIHDDYKLSLGLCLHCGKRCKFISLYQGYSLYCSNKCAFNSKEVQDKISNTMIIRYGVDNAFKSEKAKVKIRRTNLERRGVEYSLQDKQVREKGKQTKKEKYGDANYNNVEKRKQTCIGIYGEDNAAKTESTKAKIRRTNLERRGVECSLQDKQVREKGKQTKKEKYGDENYVNLEKAKRTNLQRYGAENVYASEYGKQKKKQTYLLRYGVENPFLSKELRKKANITKREKYGDENYNNREKYMNTCLERYGVPYTCMLSTARKYSNDSKINKHFSKVLKENNIKFEREFPLEKYSYDFKINDYLIEINPSGTHNTLFGLFGKKPKEKNYHLIKTNIAKKHGFKCIHVWDWDDLDKIIDIFKQKISLDFNELNIKEVSKTDADLFLNKYHIQNTCENQPIRYGLYKESELIMLMTFRKLYKKKYEYELLRICKHANYEIKNGDIKLFSYIVDKFKIKSVIFRLDNSKFYDYSNINFVKKRTTKPSLHWYKKKGNTHIIHNKSIDEDTMIKNKFLPVYDSGKCILVWQ